MKNNPKDFEKYTASRHAKGKFLEHELEPISYLLKLRRVERDNLKKIFYEVFNDKLTRVARSALFAVGSTTFSDEYWDGLEAYLKKNDRSKLDYVIHRGEDIDLLLCPDEKLSSYTSTIESYSEILSQAGIKHEIDEDGSQSGSGYLTVPKEHIKEQGQPVIRYKIIEYGVSKIIIDPENEGRKMHLSIKNNTADEQLEIEERGFYHNLKRSSSDEAIYPSFSVLFRGFNYESFPNLIDITNALEKKDMLTNQPEYMPPHQELFDTLRK